MNSSVSPVFMLFVQRTTEIKRFINLLKTKRNLLYIRNQSVPRCKNFPPRL